MPKLKYVQVLNGEWVMPMPQTGHKMACCDCGLIHRMDFAVRKGKVLFRATRDSRATANRRRSRSLSQSGSAVRGEHE